MCGLEEFLCHRLIDKRLPKHPKLHGPVRLGGTEPWLMMGRWWEAVLKWSWSWSFSRKAIGMTENIFVIYHTHLIAFSLAELNQIAMDMHMYLYIYIYTYHMHRCTHTCIYIYTYHMHRCTHICIYIYICVCTCICIYIYI